MRQGVIYKITNPTGKIYIGKAVSLAARLWAYRNLKCKDQKAIYASLKKYGFDKHIVDILYEGPAQSLADKEIAFIKKHNSFSGDNPNGLNLTRGGDGRRILSEEELKSKPVKKYGEPRKKPTYSPEVLVVKQKTARRLSEANKGRKKNILEIDKWKETKTRKRFEKLGHILQITPKGTLVKKWQPNIKEIADYMNCDPTTIRASLLSNGEKVRKGYKWKYEKQ